MAIIVSTAYEGQHQDWHIDNYHLQDHALFDEALRSLEEYLSELDRREPRYNDGGGKFITQVRDAILKVEESKKHSFLVLAVDEHTDITIDIHYREDNE